MAGSKMAPPCSRADPQASKHVYGSCLALSPPAPQGGQSIEYLTPSALPCFLLITVVKRKGYLEAALPGSPRVAAPPRSCPHPRSALKSKLKGPLASQLCRMVFCWGKHVKGVFS